ncbi:hypothetical protein P8452_65042 [Trifolium repens]|nr:hypothetical protein P8452_65042 [Trifolium repens]
MLELGSEEVKICFGYISIHFLPIVSLLHSHFRFLIILFNTKNKRKTNPRRKNRRQNGGATHPVSLNPRFVESAIPRCFVDKRGMEKRSFGGSCLLCVLEDSCHHTCNSYCR